MTFATLTNAIVSVLCALVVLQSLRMQRNIRDMKSGSLGETVKSLDRATAHARQVLAELKVVLTTEGADNARAVAAGEALRDELSLMVGIGNSVADRIMAAAENVERAREQADREASLVDDIIADEVLLDTVVEEAPVAVAAPAEPRARRSRKITAPAHTRLQ